VFRLDKCRFKIYLVRIKERIFEPQVSRYSGGIPGRVLVLNQSYEPVGVCSIQKSIILLVLSKAELVASRDDKRIHSVNFSMPFPTVIRLGRYCRVPYRDIMLSRRNILRRDGYRCQYCGTHSDSLTIDHIVPKSMGGADSWENLVTACLKCNGSKGGRRPEDVHMHLLSRPRKPSHVTFLANAFGTIHESWKPYLFMGDNVEAVVRTTCAVDC
jgi:5-methylcytosine-specific restriction endonuclease McrA